MSMKRKILIASVALGVVLAILGGIALFRRFVPFGYAHQVTPQEQILRDTVVATAEGWLGCNQSDGSHKPIINIYNSHEPLAMDYTVTYDDNLRQHRCHPM